jgi:predicted transcriptional regulator
MKKASRTTYKVGSSGEFAAWTKRVIHDPQAAHEFPKKWFETEEAAARAEQVSAEAMVKLLSPGNLAVLHAIDRHKPASVRELATLTGRKEASLSRTLKRFAQLGIVAFEDGPHRGASSSTDSNPRASRDRPDRASQRGCPGRLRSAVEHQSPSHKPLHSRRQAW